MEGVSFYNFPFSAIKFDSKPQYLINISILNIYTEFNFGFGWFCLLFFLKSLFCLTKDFYASCKC